MNGDFPITYSAEPEGTATPHGNIDELIMMAELENLMKNIERYGSIGQRTMPEYYGGVDPFVEAVDPVKGMGFMLGKKAPWKSMRDFFRRSMAKSATRGSVPVEAGAVERLTEDVARYGASEIPPEAFTHGKMAIKQPEKVWGKSLGDVWKKTFGHEYDLSMIPISKRGTGEKYVIEAQRDVLRQKRLEMSKEQMGLIREKLPPDQLSNILQHLERGESDKASKLAISFLGNDKEFLSVSEEIIRLNDQINFLEARFSHIKEAENILFAPEKWKLRDN